MNKTKKTPELKTIFDLTETVLQHDGVETTLNLDHDVCCYIDLLCTLYDKDEEVIINGLLKLEMNRRGI